MSQSWSHTIYCRARVMALVALSTLTIPSAAQTVSVRALFQVELPAGGPFPSDFFTVPDGTQLTGRRVNLPRLDCDRRPSDCEDIEVINSLDGFNLQPRLSIPLDGAIDVTSATSDAIFLLNLGDAAGEHDGSFRRIGINQVVWDPATLTLHAESDELLDQHTRYALIVTSGLRDQSGAAVGASDDLRRFRHELNLGQTQDDRFKDYRKALLDALRAAEGTGVQESDIVSLSVFTTQSVTALLETIRNQIKSSEPAAADFKLGPEGTRSVFPLDTVSGITVNQQTGDNPVSFTAVQPAISMLRVVPGAVGRIAFGSFLSPDYRIHPGEYIPAVGTRTGVPQVQSMADVYFNLYLPSGPMPVGGWPVAIYGHGSGSSKNVNGGPLNSAAMMASHGIATIGITVAGNGFGPLGTVMVNRTVGSPVILPAGGRGIDQNGDGIITDREGLRAAPPRTILDAGHGFLQTVADLMQLVRVIEVGIDVDGDAIQDLDPSRIYYFGQSLGGIYGTAFLAVEPQVRAGVPNVPGGAHVELQRLSPPGGRPIIASRLAARVPSLINEPGIIRLDGVPTPGPYFFNENVPLRDGAALPVDLSNGTSGVIRSPLVNTVAGAMDIQEYLDRTEWVMQPANPVAYSRHLRKNPLEGVPPKSVIIQFARGDQTVPNPATTAMLRAGDLADRAMLYRHDLAYAERPTLPKNPHGFMVAIGAAGGFLEIGLPVQRQIAIFFASDGALTIHPEPRRFFEVPVLSPLPEDLGFIR